MCNVHIIYYINSKYIFHNFTPFAIFLMARCLFDLNTYVHVNIKIQTFKIIIFMFQNIWNIFLCLPENLVLYIQYTYIYTILSLFAFIKCFLVTNFMINVLQNDILERTVNLLNTPFCSDF